MLGQVRLEFRGEHFSFSSPRRTLPLLAYLVLRRPQPVARDFLSFAMWPDDDEDTARGNLRRNLHHLLKCLPPAPDSQPWIAVETDGVRWNCEADAWFDIDEFERSSREPHARARAVELYRGDLLEALYEEWLGPERERLRGLYLDDLYWLVCEHRSRRDFGTAIAYAQRALAAEPLREDIVRQAMSLRYESGDRAGAVQEYRRFAVRAREELGIDPMPETTALCERLTQNDPPPFDEATLHDAKIEAGTSEAFAAPQPFVGRRNERAALATLWSRAARGRGRVVFIAGPAGIGKSRLLDDLVEHAEADGARTLHGACTEPERTPYQGILDALRANLALVALLTIKPIWLAALARVMPELSARRADLPPLPELDPDREKTRLFEAFAQTFIALAKARPLLLAIDDLQAAGEATASALAFLARRTADARVLIACAYREDDVTRAHPLRRLRRELLEEDRLETVAPRPFDVEATTELIAALAPGDALIDVATLHARSEGNPLFLRELVREVEARRESGADVSDLPVSVRDLVEVRLGRLSEGARGFAEAAAIGGSRFDVESVRDLNGWHEHETHEALRELLERGIVREPPGRARVQFVFAHQLVRAAIYDLAAPGLNTRRHLRLAEILESSEAATLASGASELARHFELGGRPKRAVVHFLRAARAASDAYANDEGARLATRGLAHAEGEDRLELFFVRERCSARRGDRSLQREDIETLGALIVPGDDARFRELLSRRIALWQATGDVTREVEDIAALKIAAAARPEHLARALLAEARLLRRRSEFDAALAGASEAYAQFEAAHDVPGRAAAARTYAGTAADAGRFDEARAILDRAHIDAQDHGADDIAARAILATANVDLALARHDYGAARTHCEEALRAARDVGDSGLEAYAHERLGIALTYDSSYESARASLERALAIATETANPRQQAIALLDLAFLLQRWGALEESTTMLGRARDLCVRSGDDLNERICRLNLAHNSLLANRLEDARQAVSAVLDDTRLRGHRWLEARALSTLAWCESGLGDDALAIEHLCASIEARRTIHASQSLEDLAELAAAQARVGDPGAAETTLQLLANELEGRSEGALASVDLPRCFATAGAASAKLGKPSLAADFLKRGRRAFEKRLERISSPEIRAAYIGLVHNGRFGGSDRGLVGDASAL